MSTWCVLRGLCYQFLMHRKMSASTLYCCAQLTNFNITFFFQTFKCAVFRINPKRILETSWLLLSQSFNTIWEADSHEFCTKILPNGLLPCGVQLDWDPPKPQVLMGWDYGPNSHGFWAQWKVKPQSKPCEMDTVMWLWPFNLMDYSHYCNIPKLSSLALDLLSWSASNVESEFDRDEQLKLFIPSFPCNWPQNLI